MAAVTHCPGEKTPTGSRRNPFQTLRLRHWSNCLRRRRRSSNQIAPTRGGTSRGQWEPAVGARFGGADRAAGINSEASCFPPSFSTSTRRPGCLSAHPVRSTTPEISHVRETSLQSGSVSSSAALSPGYESGSGSGSGSVNDGGGPLA